MRRREEGAGIDPADRVRLAALAEYSAAAIVLVDRAGLIRWASPSTVDLFGHQPDALVDSRMRDLLSPDEQADWNALAERALRTPIAPVAGTFRCRHRDGSWRWVEATVRNLLADPRVGAVMVSCHDITAREAEVAARREREERYRRIVTEAPDVIMETDAEGYVRFVNPAGLRLIGLDAGEVVDRHFSEFIRDDFRPAVLDHFRRQVAARELASYVEMPVVAAGGREVWLGQNAWLLFDNGRYRGFQAVGRDITARKQLEEQLLRARKMEALGRLAGGIAHDFNNLLATIRGNAELLLHEPAAPGASGSLRDIMAAVDRAASLTRQLLAFSRRQVVQTERFDLHALVREQEPRLRQLAGATIELVVALAPAAWEVIGDRGQVEQVVLTLVSNARDALPEGGRVRLATAPVRLAEDPGEASRTGLPPGDYVRLDVADNGPGIDEGTRARLFEPFFTTKEPGRGTGLGLASVYGLVRQMAGTVTVVSRPGDGTVFSVYLPAPGDTGAGPAS